LASNGTCTANITNHLSNRNKVINGGMIVNQRGDQSATGSEGYFACDRFKTVNGSGAQVAISQSTDTPDGFGNSMKWDCTTADTSVASNEYFIIRHAFEGRDLQDMQKGTSSAKKVVLSFYAKATKTGTYIVEFIDHDNSSRHVNKSYTVSDTNWNRYTISFPADTTGTIDNDNARSMDINFWLLAGSNYTSGSLQTAWGADTNANRAVGQVNAMDSTSNDFYLTGVQLEIDHSGLGVATDFEHRSYADELARCQRYFYMHASGTESSSSGAEAPIGLGYGYTSTNCYVVVKFPVTMRAYPSMYKVVGTDYFRFAYNGNNAYPDNVGNNRVATNSAEIYFYSGASWGQNDGGMVRVNDTNARLGFSAEL
jgi:hypothetical protein